MNELHAIIGYPLLAASALELLLGFVLLNQNERRSRAIDAVAGLAFFSSAFSLFTALMYLHAYFGHDFTIYARLSWIGWFTPVVALQFLYFLEDERSPTARVIGYVLYPFWTAVLALTLFTDLIVTRDYILIPFSNQPGPLENPLRLFGSSFAIWVVAKTIFLRRTVTGVARKSLEYFFYGVIVFGSGAGFTAGILQLFGGFGLEPGLASYFSLPWVGLTFYAIARYQLFDVRLILSRLITTLLLLIVFSAIQAGAFLLFEQALGLLPAFLGSLVLISFLFFGTPIRRQVSTLVDAIVLRDPFEHQHALREATRTLSTMLDLDELLRYIVQIAKKHTGTDHSQLYLQGEQGRLRLYPASDPGEKNAEADLLPAEIDEHLRVHQQPILLQIEEMLLSSTGRALLVEALHARGIMVIMPFSYAGRLQGALALGPKTGGRTYSQTDVLLLEALSGHAAAAIENATLFAETLRVKRSLQESESMFRVLAETAPAAIFIVRNNRLLYANPAGLRLTGISSDEIPGAEFLQFVHPDSRSLVSGSGHQGPDQGSEQSAVELKIVTTKNELRWVLFSRADTDYRGQRSFIATLVDITESKELQGRLQYLQKMEAMGKLAGGVAHDFNNILGTIVGHSSMLQLAVRRDDPLQGHVDAILAATERAASITHRLLSFGARKEAALKPCDLSTLVHQQKKFLASALPSTVRLSIAAADKALPVLADQGQIDRVLMNLVVNARDAMPDGGTIAISTGTTTIDADFISAHGFGRNGVFASITVQDSGSGMSEEVRSRIFEPFFTTKKAGKGTGFGLSIVYDIVKDHRGFISVDSKTGNGSVFTVLLPLAEGTAVLPPRAEVPQRKRTILLVDDDDGARSFTRTALEDQGYTVVEADDGARALQVFQQRPKDFHLVLTDIIMPKMNGHELFVAIRKVRPDIPFLFTSGYSEDILIDSGILEKGQAFCPKPASRSVIASMTRKILDE